ncbi:hypothetical protein Tco_0080563 [Tanacetum coccineum]
MENQEQNPPQQEQPFVAAKQKPFTRSLNMYKEYLAEFWYSTNALENSRGFLLNPTVYFGEVKGVQARTIDLKPSHATSFYKQPVDIGIHKEDQQATGGPTSLGVTSEARANPQLNSGNDALVVSTAEADPGKFAPRASSIARQVEEKEASNTINLEDLAKLVSNVQPSFKNPDSREDDPVIVVDDSDEDEEDEVHTTTNVETEDTSISKSSSPRSSQIQELTNQVLILQSQKHKLELETNKAEAALLKAQPSFPISLPTELKDLPSKFNELTEEVKGLNKQVHELEIELPGDLKENPTKLEDFTKTVTSLTS